MNIPMCQNRPTSAALSSYYWPDIDTAPGHRGMHTEYTAIK